jgi:hypothetical protein
VVDEAGLLLHFLDGASIEAPAEHSSHVERPGSLACSPVGVGAARRRGLRALARQLEELGREDRAARAWIALSARGTRGHAHKGSRCKAARIARSVLRRSLCAGSAAALERALLGLPDPWPRT